MTLSQYRDVAVMYTFDHRRNVLNEAAFSQSRKLPTVLSPNGHALALAFPYLALALALLWPLNQQRTRNVPA